MTPLQDALQSSKLRSPDPFPRSNLWPVHVLRISESKLLGKFPMDLGIPPLEIKNLTESKPRKSRLSVCGLAARKRAAASKTRQGRHRHQLLPWHVCQGQQEEAMHCSDPVVHRGLIFYPDFHYFHKAYLTEAKSVNFGRANFCRSTSARRSSSKRSTFCKGGCSGNRV